MNEYIFPVDPYEGPYVIYPAMNTPEKRVDIAIPREMLIQFYGWLSDGNADRVTVAIGRMLDETALLSTSAEKGPGTE